MSANLGQHIGFGTAMKMEPVLITVSKPLLPEFGIYHGLESCACHKSGLPIHHFTELDFGKYPFSELDRS